MCGSAKDPFRDYIPADADVVSPTAGDIGRKGRHQAWELLLGEGEGGQVDER